MAQADSQNSTAIGSANVLPVSSVNSAQTRRGILGALAGAVLVPAVPGLAQPRSNKRLIAVMEEYRATSIRMCEEIDRRDEIQFAAHSSYPKPPRSLFFLTAQIFGPDQHWPATREQIEERYVWERDIEIAIPPTDFEGNRRRRLADLERYEAECRRIDAQKGVPEADAIYEAAKAAHYAADDKLADLPADTILVVLAKLNAGGPRAHPDDDAPDNPNVDDFGFNSEMEERAYRDLWALAEREDPVATAEVRETLKELHALSEPSHSADEAV